MRRHVVTGVIFLLICVSFQSVHPQTTVSEGLLSWVVETVVIEAKAISDNSPNNTRDTGKDSATSEPKKPGNLTSSDNKAPSNVDPSALRFLEKFRERMTKGIPKLKIPVLEPLDVRTIGLSYYDPEKINITATIKDIVIANLSTFVVNKAQFSLSDALITANFTTPELSIKGSYEVSGTFNKNGRINGSGPFKIKLYNFHLYVYCKLDATLDDVIYVKALDLDYSLESAKTRFEKLTRYEPLDRFMNLVLGDFLPQAFDLVKPKIIPPIRNYLESYVNKTIAHYGIAEIFYPEYL